MLNINKRNMENKKYVPDSLSKSDKKKQIKSIKDKKERPKLKSFESKRSPWVKKFEDKYGFKITNDSRISKEIISKTGINKILDRGVAAYFNSGSRPNQTPASWSRARLASVILKGPAYKIDKEIFEKYKKK
tara:strand:+ start:303 stop:698 length:396 start_codon:yes stop_codon:yes gene_type:complete